MVPPSHNPSLITLFLGGIHCSNYPEPAFRPGSWLAALKGGVSNRSQCYDQEEADWLGDRLTREGRRFCTQVVYGADGTLTLQWG